MRYFLLGVILLLATVTPVGADGDLTAAVAAAYGARTVDAGLHAIAHERVEEISACEGCMNHDGMAAGTAEVIGYNAGYPDPVAAVVRGWQGSRLHNAILSDASYGRIGCAHTTAGGGHYFVCVLATGGSFSRSVSAPRPPVSLPNTAMW